MEYVCLGSSRDGHVIPEVEQVGAPAAVDHGSGRITDVGGDEVLGLAPGQDVPARPAVDRRGDRGRDGVTYRDRIVPVAAIGDQAIQVLTSGRAADLVAASSRLFAQSSGDRRRIRLDRIPLGRNVVLHSHRVGTGAADDRQHTTLVDVDNGAGRIEVPGRVVVAVDRDLEALAFVGADSAIPGVGVSPVTRQVVVSEAALDRVHHPGGSVQLIVERGPDHVLEIRQGETARADRDPVGEVHIHPARLPVAGRRMRCEGDRVYPGTTVDRRPAVGRRDDQVVPAIGEHLLDP